MKEYGLWRKFQKTNQYKKLLYKFILIFNIFNYIQQIFKKTIKSILLNGSSSILEEAKTFLGGGKNNKSL